MCVASVRALLALLCCALAACAATTSREARTLQAAPWLAHSASESPNESLIVVTVRNSPLTGVRAGSTARDYDIAPAYGASPRARSQVRELAKHYGLRLVNAWPIEVLNVHCVVYAAPASNNAEELIARLRTDKLVESAQPLNSFDTLVSGSGDAGQPAKQYSDPYFNLQSNLQVLEVPQAQRVSRGAGVRIAIIDTGIDAKHPELAGRVPVQRNFVGDTYNQGEKAERHGTAVAGVIAALDNNNLGIVGVAPAAQLLSLRACWPATANDARSLCNTFTLAQALSAAIDLRADIVNLSLGGPADPLLNRLVEAGLRRGIIYVGAVFPNATKAATFFPTNIAGVIAVNNSNVSSPAAEHAPSNAVSLFAPGTNILTLTPSGGYDFMSGSSLAAASVSGGIALLLAHRRNTQRAALYAALTKSVRAESVDFCLAMLVLDPAASCAHE